MQWSDLLCYCTWFKVVLFGWEIKGALFQETRFNASKISLIQLVYCIQPLSQSLATNVMLLLYLRDIFYYVE